jgi:hypothetical protein
VKPLLGRSSGAAFILLFAGCAKKPEAESTAKADSAPLVASGGQVQLVPQTERSRHFDAVNSNLELGGTLYAFADIDGDVLDIAKTLHAVFHQMAQFQPQMAPLDRQDLKGLFTDLGLNDVKALGISSVREASGNYRNRAFFYMPMGRHGLFAVLGGQPGKFESTKLAPADCDFYTECEFDIGALYTTIRSVLEKSGGLEQANAFDRKIQELGSQSGYSALELVKGLKGRLTVIVRTDPKNTFTVETQTAGAGATPPFKLPAFYALVKVTGIGAAMESVLGKDVSLAASAENGRHVFKPRTRSRVTGFDPVFEVDNGTFYFATSQPFLTQCLGPHASLDTNPQFAAELALLGPDGNGLTWVTPHFIEALKGISGLNSNGPPQTTQTLELLTSNLPTIGQPLFSVRTNLPEGILVRSNWYRSLEADVAMFTVYNPVTLGLMASMAIPAYQKVRQNAQARASSAARAAPYLQPGDPQIAAIMDNLRVLDEAAEKFYAEHNATTTTFEQLVGPDKYIPSLNPVAGEEYRTVLFKKGRPLRLFLKDGRIVTYPPPQ